MWSQSPLFFPPSFFSPGPCVISGQASDYSCDYCAAVCLRSVEAPRVLPARLCAGSQPVRQLSRSDLWPLDSNLSSLPARYCCNWQLMRPDMLSSRALNRTSIFPRHWALVFFFIFLHSLTQYPSFSPSPPCSPSIFPRRNIWQPLKRPVEGDVSQKERVGGKKHLFHSHALTQMLAMEIT